jgi:hypothetical protein
MDLGDWLRSLGLGQYDAAFRENAIDRSVLPDLTDQELEKLGVLLSHRRKLLRAIDLETTAKTSPGAAVAPAAVDTSSRAASERHQCGWKFVSFHHLRIDLLSLVGDLPDEIPAKNTPSKWRIGREVHPGREK